MFQQVGSTISTSTGDDNIVILNQAKALDDYADIIVFDGGANDIIGYALGFIDESLEKEIGTVDTSTNAVTEGDSVISDFEKIIENLKENHSNAKICYLQLFLIDDETIDNITVDESVKPEIKERRDSLFEQIKIACEKWNVEYIDVSDKFSGTGTKYRQDDWIHINEAGYEYLSTYILEKLENL